MLLKTTLYSMSSRSVAEKLEPYFFPVNLHRSTKKQKHETLFTFLVGPKLHRQYTAFLPRYRGNSAKLKPTVRHKKQTYRTKRIMITFLLKNNYIYIKMKQNNSFLYHFLFKHIKNVGYERTCPGTIGFLRAQSRTFR